jgi:beta-lactamase regulating signal transducer with metallopeptidase domain
MLFIALCVTVAVLCWAMTAVLVILLWRGLNPLVSRLSPGLAADCVFLLEILPLLTSATVVSLFVIPGYVVWEPAQTEERISLWLAGACSFALLLILTVGARLYRELKRRPVVSQDRPFIAVLGCLRQKIVVNDAAQRLLNRDELRAVLRHEAAHVDRRDNFRLLATRVISMLTLNPRAWKEMESTRAHFTEFAADSFAVTDERSALDLAQALVKVARDFSPAEYQFASSLLPRGDSIQERVLHLLNRQAQPGSNASYLAVFAVLMLALILFAALHHDLQYFCYQGLEWLVSF